VAYVYARGRGHREIKDQLAGYHGLLQVDGYAGYTRLAKRDRLPGPIQLAYCLAHARRKFTDVYKITKSAFVEEVIGHLAEVYAVEAQIRATSAAYRLEMRQSRTAPVMAALKLKLQGALGQLSIQSNLAKAIRYSLAHWTGLTLFLEDGRLEVDNNTVERSMRTIATRQSLCTPSSSIWKHWKLIARSKVTRASFTPDRLHHGRCSKVGGEDLERRSRNDLFSAKDAGFDQLAYPVAGDPALLGCLA
jgi:hypothetical protein